MPSALAKMHRLHGAASRFVECFYTWETRTRTVDIENDDGTVTSTEEEYTVAVPVSLYQAYANLEAELGRTITEDDKSNTTTFIL